VCFDTDARAAEAALRLTSRLAPTGATVARLVPPPGQKDLNDWWRSDPDAVAHELTGACTLLRSEPSATLNPPQPGSPAGASLLPHS
jgi:hypothetical protein